MHSLGPFLKIFPDAVGAVVNKLFELLTSLPVLVKVFSLSSAPTIVLNYCMSRLFLGSFFLIEFSIVTGSLDKQCPACQVADLYIFHSDCQSG